METIVYVLTKYLDTLVPVKPDMNLAMTIGLVKVNARFNSLLKHNDYFI